jgi:glycosyltransferase involved in cell wall biosynthesis
MVSHDPAMRHIDPPAGATLYPGLPRERLIELYQQCDVFVLPTYRDPLGHVLAEAAACGTPAIARDVGGVHCRIKDGISGRLIPAHLGASAWEAALQELWRDPERLLDMGREARRLAEELFAPERFAEQVKWMVAQLREQARPRGNVSSAN